MDILKGWQKQYLRSMAHHLKPVIQIGKNGITDSLINAINSALDSHELIKIKFGDFKEEKKELSNQIQEKTGGIIAGIIGNIIILYKKNPDEDKRKIHIPTKK